MPRKWRTGTRAVLARLFAKPYEPVQVHGDVHDLARVGGVSMFSLPREFAPGDGDLLIPTRFAAMADYLVTNGEYNVYDVVVEENVANDSNNRIH
jgi:hypothetical protein